MNESDQFRVLFWREEKKNLVLKSVPYTGKFLELYVSTFWTLEELSCWSFVLGRSISVISKTKPFPYITRPLFLCVWYVSCVLGMSLSIYILVFVCKSFSIHMESIHTFKLESSTRLWHSKINNTKSKTSNIIENNIKSK